MEQETIEKAAKTKPNYTWSNPILTVEISIHTGKDSPQTKTTMKQEIISDKAQDYVSRLYAENEYPCGIRDIESDVMEAFEDGAHWRISSVWHDASEEPRIGEHIIAIDESGFIAEECYYGRMYGTRWAYIDDLLPERKEETK